MRLSLFVHDLFLEIGHSNAMIETLRNVDPALIERLDIVVFSSDDPEKLFPQLKGKLYLHKIPFAGLKPFLLKAFFYHFAALIVALFRLPKHSLKISVGTASLLSDVVNIQFVTSQWTPYFFKSHKLNPFSYIYKRLLHFYSSMMERLIYKRKKTHFLFLANFIKDYCQNKFKVSEERSHVIYSSVSRDRFQVTETARLDLLKALTPLYPVLSTVDPFRPIALFVGAFERKGLKEALDALERAGGGQMIVVGASESKRPYNFKREKVEVFHVPFTREVPKFYQLADAFIFPSIYEPFGLVLLEAAIMGLDIYTLKHNIGASELMDKLEGVHLAEAPEEIFIGALKMREYELKVKRAEERWKRFQEHSWHTAGKKFEHLLKLVAHDSTFIDEAAASRISLDSERHRKR